MAEYQLRIECRDCILTYADEEMQRNAALTGENMDYVMTVLFMLRNDYQRHIERNDITFVPDQAVVDYLESIKPWL
jgi:hypothetical protein